MGADRKATSDRSGLGFSFWLIVIIVSTAPVSAQAQQTGATPSENPQSQVPAPASVNPVPPPLAAPPSAIPPGDLFTFGDPLAGVGKSLANLGIYLKGFFESTLYSNMSGGIETGMVVYNEAFYGADFDLDQMAGVPGAVVLFSRDSRFGGFPQGVNNFTGSSLGFLQGTGPDNKTRLNELTWDQHLWDDRIRFVVGRQTLANYFATSLLYCQFITSVCGNLTPYNWSLDSNNPFWPIAVWAGEVSLWPTKHLYLRAGASEDNVAQFDDAGFPWDAGWSTKQATGVFVPVEVGYITQPSDVRYPGKYDVGFYYDTSNFPDAQYNTLGQKLAFAGGTPANDGSRTVVYGEVTQMVWRPDPSKPQGLNVFAGALFNTSGRAPVQAYFQVGLVERGTFPSRPNDTVAFLFLHGLFNHRFTGALDDRIAVAGLSGNISNTQQVIELNYGLELARGLQIEPYTDFTFHPDQALYAIAHATGHPMSHFMLRWQFKDDVAKALVGKPQDRTGPARTLVESFGGKMHHYFFVFGDYDGLAICEFPDNTSVAACSLKAMSTGAFTRFETTTLLTAKEAESAMKQAHDTRSEYKPPHA